MTPSQRRTYSSKYRQLIKALEVKFAGRIYRAIRKQVSSFTGTLESQGVSAAISHAQITLFNPDLEDVIKGMYQTAGLMRATQMRGELRQEQLKHIARLKERFPDHEFTIKRFGRNDEMIDLILDYLNKYILDRSIRPISNTTREWVLRKISEGVEEGKGAAEIARWITSDPDNVKFLRYQALRIVRTETTRAANVGAMVAGQTSPFETVKEWIAANDHRTRHTHMMLDGKVVDVDMDFLPNLAQPGDPRAAAELVINCRCTVAVRAKRDENGRLVRRQQMFA